MRRDEALNSKKTSSIQNRRTRLRFTQFSKQLPKTSQMKITRKEMKICKQIKKISPLNTEAPAILNSNEVNLQNRESETLRIQAFFSRTNLQKFQPQAITVHKGNRRKKWREKDCFCFFVLRCISGPLKTEFEAF